MGVNRWFLVVKVVTRSGEWGEKSASGGESWHTKLRLGYNNNQLINQYLTDTMS